MQRPYSAVFEGVIENDKEFAPFAEQLSALFKDMNDGRKAQKEKTKRQIQVMHQNN